MIIQEQISEALVKTYSDRGVYIHGGFPEADYEEAIDPISASRQYVETDREIEGVEITARQALNILMGRDPDEQQDSDVVPEEN